MTAGTPLASLLEVGGYLGTQGHSAGEWMAQGGIVGFTGNDVVTQAGSQIQPVRRNPRLQGGYIRQTWLKGSDGRLCRTRLGAG